MDIAKRYDGWQGSTVDALIEEEQHALWCAELAEIAAEMQEWEEEELAGFESCPQAP